MTILEIHAEQAEINKLTSKEEFTTVGFEFDYLKLEPDDLLSNLAHYTIAKSKTEINGLPYLLETDAGNILELVTPPFYVPRAGDVTQDTFVLPDKSSTENLRSNISEGLKKLPKSKNTIAGVIEFLNLIGIDLELTEEAIKAHNMMNINSPKVIEGIAQKKVSINDKNVGKFQVSMMIDLIGMNYLYESGGRKLGKNLEEKRAIFDKIKLSSEIKMEDKPSFLLKLLTKTVEDYLAVHSLFALKLKQEAFFDSKPVDKDRFKFHAHLSSIVKDRANLWLRYDIISMIHNELNTEEREELYSRIVALIGEKWQEDTIEQLEKETEVKKDHRDHYAAFLSTDLIGHLNKIKDNNYVFPESYSVKNINEHDKEILGVRQDTFIGSGVLENLKGDMKSTNNLYVVEMRKSSDTSNLPNTMKKKQKGVTVVNANDWFGLEGRQKKR